MAAVQDLLSGREGGRLQQAVSAMSDALHGGEPLGEAVTAFWQGMHNENPA